MAFPHVDSAPCHPQADLGEEEVLLLHLIASHIPALLFAVDRTGAITHADHPRLLGFGLDHHIKTGENLFEACAHRADILDPVRRALSGNEHAELLRAPGKRVFNVHFRPVRLEDGTVIGALTIAREMTEQIRSDEALELSALKFDRLAETLSAYVFIIQGTRFVYVNPALLRASGYTREELFAMHFWDLAHPDVRDLLRERGLARQRGEAVPERYELRLLTKDGDEVWVDYAATAISHSGELIVLGVALDTTRLREANGTIMRQEAALIEASKRTILGELAGGIVHEVNGPLAVVAAAADQIASLVQHDRLDKKAAEALTDTMTRTIDHLSRIVTSVRCLSCDTASEPAREVSARSIIDDAACLCGQRFHLSQVPLDLSLSSEELTLECHPTQILEVVLNLLYNANDAVKGLPERWVRLEVAEETDKVLFSVTDSGPGINPDITDHIFDTFFSTKESAQGTGLGLGIARRIVERHGGRIALDQTCPHTRFVVELPRCQPGPPPIAE